MKYLSREGLVYLWGKMKDTFALKDHTHPPQTDVTGTAGSLKTPRKIALQGVVTGETSFDGSRDVSITAKGQYEVLALSPSVSWKEGADSATATLTTTLALDPASQCILVRPDTGSMSGEAYQALAEAGLYASDAKAHQITLTTLNADAAKTLNIKIVVSIVG